MKLNTLFLLALFSLAAEARDDSRARGGLRRVLKGKKPSADAPVDMEADDPVESNTVEPTPVEPSAESKDTEVSMDMSMSSSKGGKKSGGSAKKEKKVKSSDSKRGSRLKKSTKGSKSGNKSTDKPVDDVVIQADSEDMVP